MHTQKEIIRKNTKNQLIMKLLTIRVHTEKIKNQKSKIQNCSSVLHFDTHLIIGGTDFELLSFF